MVVVKPTMRRVLLLGEEATSTWWWWIFPRALTDLLVSTSVTRQSVITVRRKAL